MSAETSIPGADRTDSRRFDAVAITLHWLLALMILGAICIAVYMTGLDFSLQRLRVYNWHKWTGISILALSAVRLLWRLAHRPPPLPPRIVRAMPGWQLRAHRGLHLLLYLLFFIVPLLGWAYSSALGFPIVWFGVLPLPDWVPVNQDFAESVLKPLHKGSAFTLALVATVHVAAALKHQFIDRDGLIDRMWPRRNQEPRT